MRETPQEKVSQEGLVRVIGRWSLAALVTNCIIGSGVFGLPSVLAAQVGRTSVLAVPLAAVAAGVVMACFAEVSSRFKETGGPYLYAREAFGRFMGIQVGWLVWFVRLTACAANANLFVTYVGEFWRPATEAIPKLSILTLLIGILAAVNFFGARAGTRVSTTFTIAKLVSLGLVAVAGAASAPLISALIGNHGVTTRHEGREAYFMRTRYSRVPVRATRGERLARQGIRPTRDPFPDESNQQNYESACPWDICSLRIADEMVEKANRMAIEDMDDLHRRIARVTEDLRTIQQELNCAAMQAPSDPELMEALNSLSETEPIETLRTALDQMRHFLWFYSQVMDNEPELGDKLREAGPAKLASDEKPKVEKSFLDKLSRADELMLLRHLAEAKQRKPN